MATSESVAFNTDQTLFVDVILPVPIPQLFTYRVPKELNSVIKIGSRMVVEFGKSRVMTAVISKIHPNPPATYQAKYISELLDIYPVVTLYQLWLFNWISEYYQCFIGEVMNIALPAGFKISSQSKIQINPEFCHPELLNDKEKDLLEILEQQESLSYEEIGRIVETNDVNKVIKELIGKKAIILFEEIKDKFKPKILKKVKLNAELENPDEVLNLIENLEKNRKQQAAVLEYLNHISVRNLIHFNQNGVAKQKLKAAKISDSSLKTLIDKGVFEEFEQIVSRFDDIPYDKNKTVLLSNAQQAASNQILTDFQEKDIVLLHGITGSGKTEIYIDLIKKVLETGSQVLFLLPEIALTTQIVSRLRLYFGNTMGVYHSKFSDNERVEVWKGVLDGTFQFVVGVRSAIFLPFENLGLIIVDEEHESSYKQYDPAPRYHARDVAIMLALKQSAKVLLGSATPSMESYFQAKEGRYGFVKLSERFGDAQLPNFSLVDLKKQRLEKTLVKEFSSDLVEAIKTNIKNKEQTIIFQNRRGYAPYVNCGECNWISHCEQCSVTLTLHMYSKTLVCHYCGHSESLPKICPDCGSIKMNPMGVGTERIEDDLHEIFPNAGIKRMDLDTTRSKNAFQDLINEFENGDVDILVGTQMVSKGLDFDRLTLVGVYNVDKMLNYPDFRSAERAFQLITQVAGRAGRRGKMGQVLIQTANPQNKILQFIVNNDYEGFYESEILERKGYNYPPFSRVIEVIVKDFDQILAHKGATRLAGSLCGHLGKERILGPEKAVVERIRNKFLYVILIKLEKDRLNMQAAKIFLKEQIVNLVTEKAFKSLQIVVNVDAY